VPSELTNCPTASHPDRASADSMQTRRVPAADPVDIDAAQQLSGFDAKDSQASSAIQYVLGRHFRDFPLMIKASMTPNVLVRFIQLRARWRREYAMTTI
jgi:hypothetical protein